ncbi:MAG: hypothetical protein C4543_04800 [Ignavibacteriales bacterium]|jgi:hypothetical protein|nr:MAG: hypothetical protein C4543_04800 [Ignavibacteriales bacterium]
MTSTNDFKIIFDRLKENFNKYDKELNVLKDEKENYSLEGFFSERFKKNLWFGGVEVKKNYVSYHLMPIYMYKDIVKNIPKNLKKHMRGKSCFNFKSYDESLFAEMEKFTDLCFREFKKRGDKI